jgi:hypothetical protein
MAQNYLKLYTNMSKARRLPAIPVRTRLSRERAATLAAKESWDSHATPAM